MNGLSSFTSIFEIFSLVYISATTIKFIIDDLKKTNGHEDQLVEDSLNLLKNYTESEAIGLKSLKHRLFRILTGLIFVFSNSNSDNSEFDESNENERLVVKYRPVFFFSSLYCFVCLIISGIDEELSFNFLSRFVILTYITYILYLTFTYSKSHTLLMRFDIGNNWIYTITYAFILLCISQLILSFDSKTFYYSFSYTLNKVFGQSPILFFFSSVFVITANFIAMAFLIKFIIIPIFRKLKVMVLLLILFEIAIRFHEYFVNKYNIIHSFFYHKNFFIGLTVAFAFIPVISLFFEYYIPTVLNRVKLSSIHGYLESISEENLEYTEIINERNEKSKKNHFFNLFFWGLIVLILLTNIYNLAIYYSKK